MNIRTKLLITFGVVVAVPLFLISLVFFGFMSMQPAEVATPQIREFLGEMLVSVILIMAMTCSFLMAWIYRSILTPIETLKKQREIFVTAIWILKWKSGMMMRLVSCVRILRR